MILSHQERTELRKPTPIDLVLSRDINIDAIEAVGYGNLRKEYPLELMSFQRRAPRDFDVVIKIMYCGVCHSDWHIIRDEWKNTKYPIIVGHEIIGQIIKVGTKVSKYKIGDIVGLGPNFDSCQQCSQCNSNFEQYCINDVPERLPGEIKGTGPITQGGYSNIIVANERYVLSIPNNIDNTNLARLAPVLCAASTLYTPLKYCGLPKGSRVGIVGFGGLGHIGCKLASSMGYEVIVLTTTPNKIADAIRMGASQALLSTDLDLVDGYRQTFDLIICTIPFRHDTNMYIELLKPNSTMWMVGAMIPLTIDLDIVNRKGKVVRGSSTAGIMDTQECINYCVANNIYPEIQLISAKDINLTHRKIVNKEVRYRYVLDMTTMG